MEEEIILSKIYLIKRQLNQCIERDATLSCFGAFPSRLTHIAPSIRVVKFTQWEFMMRFGS
jgi:hypothetical protein